MKKIKLSYETLLYKWMIQTFEADFESTYIKGIFYHAFLQTLKDVKKFMTITYSSKTLNTNRYVYNIGWKI